jgi:deazaflavin-dependent oxidoreductase (nitroreductase family)
MVSLEISPYDKANAFFRIMRRSAGWPPFLLLYERILPPADRFVFRITRGRKTFIGLVTGLPALMLTTTGARSGAQRTHPLAYLGKDGDFVVIGANWAKRGNPQWYHNLRANPDAKVTVAGTGLSYDVRAREVTGPDRDPYWEQGCRMFPPWKLYAARAHRDLPVLILARQEEQTSPTRQHD